MCFREALRRQRLLINDLKAAASLTFSIPYEGCSSSGWLRGASKSALSYFSTKKATQWASQEERRIFCDAKIFLHTLEAALWGQGRLTAFLEMKKKDGMENLESFCNNLDGDKEWGCWETKKRPWKFGIGLFTESPEGQMVLGRILMNLESQWLINTRIYEYLRQKN